MVDANVPDIALEPDKTVKKVSWHCLLFEKILKSYKMVDLLRHPTNRIQRRESVANLEEGWENIPSPSPVF